MIACWVCVVNCISAKVLHSTRFLLMIAYCAVERQYARYYREGICTSLYRKPSGKALVIDARDEPPFL
jgi:hypothetical protein